MTLIEMEKYDNTPITNEKPVAERLPNLDEEDVRSALSHQQLAWCHGFMDHYKDGQTFYMKEHGIHLQRVNETDARCIAIVDHPLCYEALAILWRSFERSGIVLQVDPYTVTIPHEPREKQEHIEEAAGVEVV
jgi:hypothetical protein